MVSKVFPIKIIALLGATAISIGTVGGIAFANDFNNNLKLVQPIEIKESNVKILAAQNDSIKIQDLVERASVYDNNLKESISIKQRLLRTVM